jgi:hypothetical protein
MIARLDVKALVRNVPVEVYKGDKHGFMVVKVDGTDLWYYGRYETQDRAEEVALEIGGIFLEV